MGLFDKTNGHGDIEFGRVYKDRITSFEGTCTGISRFISGCDQVLIVPTAKDGEYREGHWFDDDRLVDVEKAKPVERTSKKGGPNQTPARSH